LKKPLALDPEVMERLARLPKSERAECLQALCDLCETFGRPHAHSGTGIRKLGDHLFECRGNLALRFIFLDRPDCMYVRLLGDHAEVRQFLKKGRR
jgi:hypothetical protein